MPAKKIAAVFYCGRNGAEPVRDWLKSMDKSDRLRIGEDIRTVEFGWPVGMPFCRPLGRGLYEVRSRLKNRIARVLFGIVNDEMVIVHGFIKKSPAARADDIGIARTRLKDYRRCS